MPGHFFSRISFRERTAIRVLHVIVWPILTVICAGGAGIRLNLSASVPIGLYRITGDTASEFVEFCPPEPFGSLSVQRGYRSRALGCPDGGEPLLKPIVAREGDLVKILTEGIFVNGALIPNTAAKSRDSAGRDLSHWPFGEYSVAPGSVWVASSYSANSLDGRYFGPIRVADIRHKLRALWVTQ